MIFSLGQPRNWYLNTHIHDVYWVLAVLAIEFLLCVNNWVLALCQQLSFWLCINDECSICDDIVMWPWDGFPGFGMVFLCSQYIYIYIQINGSNFVEFIWKLPNHNTFCKMIIIMKLSFSIPLLIMILTRI